MGGHLVREPYPLVGHIPHGRQDGDDAIPGLAGGDDALRDSAQAFDPGDEDSCPKCVGPAMRGEPGLAYRDRREQEPPTDRLSELIDELETQRASAERED